MFSRAMAGAPLSNCSVFSSSVSCDTIWRALASTSASPGGEAMAWPVNATPQARQAAESIFMRVSIHVLVYPSPALRWCDASARVHQALNRPVTCNRPMNCSSPS